MKYFRIPYQPLYTPYLCPRLSLLRTIEKKLKKLISNYDTRKIYEASEVQSFYCKRSSILSPFSYLMSYDIMFLNLVQKYELKYVVRKLYHSGSETYVKIVRNGAKNYSQIYRYAPSNYTSLNVYKYLQRSL